MKSDIPFFRNLDDDTHCFRACMKMVLNHFFPKKRFSYSRLDLLTPQRYGKGHMVNGRSLAMKNMGLNVKIFSMFDYRKFAKNGIEYMMEYYGKGAEDLIEKKSSLEIAMKDAEMMVRHDMFNNKRLYIKDVENLFKKDA